MLDFCMEGKVAVITGGAGVLCSTMGSELAGLGAKVVLLDMDGARAKEAAESIGGEVVGLRADVLDKASLIKARDKIISRFGKLDILINGAGGNKPSATAGKGMSFFELSEDAVKWVMELNFMGTLLPSQVFGEVMAEQEKGVILNISSMAALIPLTNTVAYSAAKASVSNFTQWLAVYMCQNVSPNIRVNAIAPGFLLTQQNRFLLVNEDGTPTERGKKIIQGTPMGRYGAPEEIVGAAVYLCSEAAGFVTGCVLPIDGGFSAYSGV